jgi:hypothetical protein
MRLSRKVAASGGALALAAIPHIASAHVKWFCAYDVAGQPEGLANVLCLNFELLTGLSLALLCAGFLVERTLIGRGLLWLLDLATALLRQHTDKLIRATCGMFFVALWTAGGIILTPELKTTLGFVPWLQLAIAACLIWRRTLPLAALGIVFLYGLAVHNYGVFHLMDYPIFLGVAAYLALTGLRCSAFGMRPLDVVRWAASITLMWASVEKWAYPEWSYPLFTTHPAMGMGFDPQFMLQAAGAVEFALAFALICTPLVRRVAGIILIFLFTSAVFEFGKIDAIGHSVIIVMLVAFVADDAGPKAPRLAWRPFLTPTVGYATALAGFVYAYYEAHAAMFGTTIF